MQKVVPDTYEQDLAVFVQLLEEEQDNLWAQAAWAMAMTERYGRGTPRMLAADTGLSASYVRQLVATAKAFPTEESRARDLSFSHHRVAAMTEEPERWIALAVEKGLSVAELRQAIGAARERLSEAEEARRAEERIVQAVRRYNELYSGVTGRKAVVLFEAAGRRSA
jgi:hypothetical protein